MGIGGVTSASSMSGMQITTANLTDQKSKNIQNELTNVQQKVQKLSTNEDLSVNETAKEQKKLQRELSDLNTELRQRQDELRKSYKKETRMAELKEEQKPAREEKSEDSKATVTSPDQDSEKNVSTDGQQTMQPGTVIFESSDGTVIFKGEMKQEETDGADTAKIQAEETKEEKDIAKKETAEKEPKTTDSNTVTDTGLSHRQTQAMISADSSAQQANRQGIVITQARDDIAVLKGEINQDEKRGVNTERKQAELEEMEKKEQRATAFQSSLLGEAMKTAAGTNAAGTGDRTLYAGNNAFINAMNVSQEDPASQQRFHISIV